MITELLFTQMSCDSEEALVTKTELSLKTQKLAETIREESSGVSLDQIEQYYKEHAEEFLNWYFGEYAAIKESNKNLSAAE